MELPVAALGLAILLLGGDALVRGAVNLSLRLGVPALVVSLTVVAFGTSAPELLVSVQAVLDGAPGLALGNVIGSNTANVLLVLGLPALLVGLPGDGADTRRSFAQMLAATAGFIALAWLGPLGALHGGLLVAGLAAVLTAQLRRARPKRAADAAMPAGAGAAIGGVRTGAYLLVGLVALPVGAELLIRASVRLAEAMGVSDAVIGVTLVAVGTSLPELATTVVAALRRHAAVALGNVIGSNIFNLLGIAGAAALVGRVPVAPELLALDVWVMAAASLLLAPFVLWGWALSRGWGAGLMALYALYLWTILF